LRLVRIQANPEVPFKTEKIKSGSRLSPDKPQKARKFKHF
jgi:hypothetical protein